MELNLGKKLYSVGELEPLPLNHALSLVSAFLSTTLPGLIKEGDEIGFYTRSPFHTSNFFLIPLND